MTTRLKALSKSAGDWSAPSSLAVSRKRLYSSGSRFLSGLAGDFDMSDTLAQCGGHFSGEVLRKVRLHTTSALGPSGSNLANRFSSLMMAHNWTSPVRALMRHTLEPSPAAEISYRSMNWLRTIAAPIISAPTMMAMEAAHG